MSPLGSKKPDLLNSDYKRSLSCVEEAASKVAQQSNNTTAGAGKVSRTDFMFDDPLLKLMSVSLVTSEGSLPLIPHQNLFYHQQILHHQQSSREAAAAAMLVHNGRLPGGSPVPIPSPTSSLSHPESPRSQAADSSSSPPMTMTIDSVPAITQKSQKVNGDDDKEEIIMDPDEEDNESVLSIGGKDDEQMMMDCDSSSVPERSSSVITEKEKGGSNKINGRYGNDDDESDKKRSPKQDSPSASLTPNASIGDEEEDNDEPLDEDERDKRRLKSHKSTQDRKKSHNNPFHIANLSSHSPTEDIYRSHLLHHQISPLPHPTNYFLQHNHLFHQHLINNHDTSSNHSTASSTNNSTSPSPSSTFNGSFLQHHHQQQQQRQQQTAAVAAAQSLIFSIANILRPDFGLCNNNNNDTGGGGKSNSSHNLAALGFGAKRHSSGGTSDKNHYNGKNAKRSGHREPSQHRTPNPIDLSRPSSTGSASMQMISPNSIITMMLDRGGVQSGTQNKSRQHHHHHQQHKSKSEKHPHPPPERRVEKQRVVTPSSSSANPESSGGTPNKITTTPTTNNKANKEGGAASGNQTLWPAWVYCTRYSDRPSSGPRTRRVRKNKEKEVDEKRPRTAFTAEQLARLKKEFEENRYLTEKRRQDLAKELKLHENQIKIWFQNKRAKLKKATGSRGGLAQQLMAQGLYNHSTIPPRGPGEDSDDDDDDDDC